MSQILVLHGPNLNLLGQREPHLYGARSLDELNDTLITQGLTSGMQVECKQSNAEAELVGFIQQAPATQVGFIILNAAAFTHTSIAIRDALLAVQLPFIEVHLTNIYGREAFRMQSYLADIANGVIMGLGPLGYELALKAAIKHLNKE